MHFLQSHVVHVTQDFCISIGGTRTCIHTPSAPLAPEELEPKFNGILENASIVYFDGRLTEAAVPLARAARKSGM